MRIDTGLHGEEAIVGSADDADAAVIIGNIFQQPGDGIEGVSAFVHLSGSGGGRGMVNHGAHHDELALGLVTAANIFQNKNVATAREFGALLVDGVGGVAGNSVRSAVENKGQGFAIIGRPKNHGVKFQAIAHGNHGLLALVRAKTVGDRCFADFFSDG